MESLYRRSIRIVGGAFLVYAVLVATHLGEFWPFSIYPMFSTAGNPWSRAIVREVDFDAQSIEWQPVDENNLPGTAYARSVSGVDPIDLANFVSKTVTWNAERVEGIRYMFRADELGDKRILVMRARGGLQENDQVGLTFEPYVLMGGQMTLLNPNLPR